jgi:hypothetical protein
MEIKTGKSGKEKAAVEYDRRFFVIAAPFARFAADLPVLDLRTTCGSNRPQFSTRRVYSP